MIKRSLGRVKRHRALARRVCLRVSPATRRTSHCPSRGRSTLRGRAVANSRDGVDDPRDVVCADELVGVTRRGRSDRGEVRRGDGARRRSRGARRGRERRARRRRRAVVEGATLGDRSPGAGGEFAASKLAPGPPAPGSDGPSGAPCGRWGGVGGPSGGRGGAAGRAAQDGAGGEPARSAPCCDRGRGCPRGVGRRAWSLRSEARSRDRSHGACGTMGRYDLR